MRVSTRVEYGMLALTDIALHSENGSAVSGPEIAERQEISQKYLEQILTQLKQAGLKILNALDNSILEETDSAGETDGRSLRGTVNDCVWKELNHSIIIFAESRMLSDIMQKCRELSGNWDMYVI